jgi:ABC-2 type transport system permease protein
MQKIFAIISRDLLSLFVSPIAYLVLTLFLLVSGYFFFGLLGTYNVVLNQYAMVPNGMTLLAESNFNLNARVISPYFHVIAMLLVFLVPLVTMRSIAEERREGTFELLLTSSLSLGELLSGKIISATLFVSLAVLASSVFPLLLWWYGAPAPELAPIVLGISSLLVCSLAFVTIGIAASALTNNNLLAALSSTTALLLLCAIHAPSESLSGILGTVLQSLSPLVHLDGLFRGVLTVGSIAYFVSLTAVGFSLAISLLAAERWR